MTAVQCIKPWRNIDQQLRVMFTSNVQMGKMLFPCFWLAGLSIFYNYFYNKIMTPRLFYRVAQIYVEAYLPAIPVRSNLLDIFSKCKHYITHTCVGLASCCLYASCLQAIFLYQLQLSYLQNQVCKQSNCPGCKFICVLNLC